MFSWRKEGVVVVARMVVRSLVAKEKPSKYFVMCAVGSVTMTVDTGMKHSIGSINFIIKIKV